MLVRPSPPRETGKKKSKGEKERKTTKKRAAAKQDEHLIGPRRRQVEVERAGSGDEEEEVPVLQVPKLPSRSSSLWHILLTRQTTPISESVNVI